MQKRFSILAIVVILTLVFNVYGYAVEKDEMQYLKSQKLFNESKAADEEIPQPARDGGPGAPSAPAVPTPDDPNAPIPQDTKLYYCVVPYDHVVNLEALCQKYKADMMVFRTFHQLLILKRVGVIVTVDPKNKYFIQQLRKYYNAKPLKDVSLKVKIHVSSLAYAVNMEKEDFLVADFKRCNEILENMIKVPYGNNCTMFKTIAKTFPGLLDKVTVIEKEYLGLGKKRKMLLNPVVTIEMLALNMNGKNKNVTLYHNKFYYQTIKHSTSYNWGGKK